MTRNIAQKYCWQTCDEHVTTSISISFIIRVWYFVDLLTEKHSETYDVVSEKNTEKGSRPQTKQSLRSQPWYTPLAAVTFCIAAVAACLRALLLSAASCSRAWCARRASSNMSSHPTRLQVGSHVSTADFLDHWPPQPIRYIQSSTVLPLASYL